MNTETQFLPIADVERIFNKLAMAYGNDWTAKWRGADYVRLQIEWSEQLGGLHESQIEFALENLPERAPNLIVFKKLAQQAPAGSAVHSGSDDPLYGKSMFLVTIGRYAFTAVGRSMEEATEWAKRRADGASVRVRELRNDEAPGLALAEEYDRLRASPQNAPRRAQKVPDRVAPMPAAKSVPSAQFDDAEGLPW